MIERLGLTTDVPWALVLGVLNAVAVLGWLAARCRLVLARRPRTTTGSTAAESPTVTINAHPDDLALAAALAYADAGRESGAPAGAEAPADRGEPRDAERRLADDIARFRARVRGREPRPAGAAPQEAAR